MSDAIKCLRLFDNPQSKNGDPLVISDQLMAEEIASFFDVWAEALTNYLWEKAEKSTKANAEHVLMMVRGIWEVQLEALKGWVGLESAYGLDTPEIIKTLEGPDQFNKAASELVDFDSTSRIEKPDIDLEALLSNLDLSEI